MDTINNLLELRRLSLSEMKERQYITDDDIITNFTYQGLNGVTRVYNTEFFPGLILFQNDKVVLIYTSDAELIANISVDELIKEYGDKDENSLRSRAGKKSNLMVYPEVGFALSVGGGEVEFIELFQPTTMEQYKNEIYQEPGPFIR